MQDFLLILLMIFPWIWIGITFWTIKTKKTQHWLYKAWLWLHWFVVSFMFILVMTIPIMVVFFGIFLIPLSIWGLSKILKSLGANSTSNYTKYNIIATALVVIITLSTAKSIENDEPGFLSFLLSLFYLIFSFVFAYKAFHTNINISSRKA